MKLKENYEPYSIGEKEVLIPIGPAVIDVQAMLDLNELGAFIVHQLQDRDCTQEELVELIYQEYNAEKDTIRADVMTFIQKAKRIGFIE